MGNSDKETASTLFLQATGLGTVRRGPRASILGLALPPLSNRVLHDGDAVFIPHEETEGLAHPRIFNVVGRRNSSSFVKLIDAQTGSSRYVRRKDTARIGDVYVPNWEPRRHYSIWSELPQDHQGSESNRVIRDTVETASRSATVEMLNELLERGRVAQRNGDDAIVIQNLSQMLVMIVGKRGLRPTFSFIRDRIGLDKTMMVRLFTDADTSGLSSTVAVGLEIYDALRGQSRIMGNVEGKEMCQDTISSLVRCLDAFAVSAPEGRNIALLKLGWHLHSGGAQLFTKSSDQRCILAGSNRAFICTQIVLNAARRQHDSNKIAFQLPFPPNIGDALFCLLPNIDVTDVAVDDFFLHLDKISTSYELSNIKALLSGAALLDAIEFVEPDLLAEIEDGLGCNIVEEALSLLFNSRIMVLSKMVIAPNELQGKGKLDEVIPTLRSFFVIRILELTGKMLVDAFNSNRFHDAAGDTKNNPTVTVEVETFPPTDDPFSTILAAPRRLKALGLFLTWNLRGFTPEAVRHSEFEELITAVRNNWDDVIASYASIPEATYHWVFDKNEKLKSSMEFLGLPIALPWKTISALKIVDEASKAADKLIDGYAEWLEAPRVKELWQQRKEEDHIEQVTDDSITIFLCSADPENQRSKPADLTRLDGFLHRTGFLVYWKIHTGRILVLRPDVIESVRELFSLTPFQTRAISIRTEDLDPEPEEELGAVEPFNVDIPTFGYFLNELIHQAPVGRILKNPRVARLVSTVRDRSLFNKKIVQLQYIQGSVRRVGIVNNFVRNQRIVAVVRTSIFIINEIAKVARNQDQLSKFDAKLLNAEIEALYENAQVIISKTWRGIQVRRLYRDMIMKRDIKISVALIQLHAARLLANSEIMEDLLALRKFDTQASIIQAAFKGKKDRTRFIRLHGLGSLTMTIRRHAHAIIGSIGALETSALIRKTKAQESKGHTFSWNERDALARVSVRTIGNAWRSYKHHKASSIYTSAGRRLVDFGMTRLALDDQACFARVGDLVHKRKAARFLKQIQPKLLGRLPPFSRASARGGGRASLHVFNLHRMELLSTLPLLQNMWNKEARERSGSGKLFTNLKGNTRSGYQWHRHSLILGGQVRDSNNAGALGVIVLIVRSLLLQQRHMAESRTGVIFPQSELLRYHRRWVSQVSKRASLQRIGSFIDDRLAEVWNYNVVEYQRLKSLYKFGISIWIGGDHGIIRIQTTKKTEQRHSELVLAFGNNLFGQLGNVGEPKGIYPISNEFMLRTPAFEVSLPSSMSEVSMGEGFTVILTKSGEVFTWGINSRGQCGAGKRAAYVTTPQRLMLGNSRVKHISASKHHCLALTESKTHPVWVWGWAPFVMLTDSLEDRYSVFEPMPVPFFGSEATDEAYKFFPSAVYASVGFSAVLFNDMRNPVHLVALWGRNDCGQLGRGRYVGRKEIANLPDDVAPSIKAQTMKEINQRFITGRVMRYPVPLYFKASMKSEADELGHRTFAYDERVKLVHRSLKEIILWSRSGLAALVPLSECPGDNVRAWGAIQISSFYRAEGTDWLYDSRFSGGEYILPEETQVHIPFWKWCQGCLSDTHMSKSNCTRHVPKEVGVTPDGRFGILTRDGEFIVWDSVSCYNRGEIIDSNVEAIMKPTVKNQTSGKLLKGSSAVEDRFKIWHRWLPPDRNRILVANATSLRHLGSPIIYQVNTFRSLGPASPVSAFHIEREIRSTPSELKSV